jgi:TrmH family RNA methyltransferase
MMPPVVVVVGAKTPGNVGTIARAMKNFGFPDLKLVDPPELERDGEAYGFAGQAREDVLPDHDVVTFEEVVETYHTVGFTAIPNEDPTNHVRYPVRTPGELAESLAGVDADTALVFGRERVGLTNEELAAIDEICSIPANPDYPVLNLGQAATVALYELRGLALDDDQHPEERHERVDEAELERFYDHFETFLAEIDHPEEKRPKTARMMRRLLGRAHPTTREVSTLFGVLRRASRRREE